MRNFQNTDNVSESYRKNKIINKKKCSNILEIIGRCCVKCGKEKYQKAGERTIKSENCLNCNALYWFQCRACGMCFKQRGTAYQHINYERERLFQKCPCCEFSSNKRAVRQHVESQHSESFSNYLLVISNFESKLKTFCADPFSLKPEDSKEMFQPTNTKIWSCKLCSNFESVYKFTLFKHRETYHPDSLGEEKQFFCSGCGKTYSTEGRLENHKMRKCNIAKSTAVLKIFRCAHCSYVHSSRNSFVIHVKRHLLEQTCNEPKKRGRKPLIGPKPRKGRKRVSYMMSYEED